MAGVWGPSTAACLGTPRQHRASSALAREQHSAAPVSGGVASASPGASASLEPTAGPSAPSPPSLAALAALAAMAAAADAAGGDDWPEAGPSGAGHDDEPPKEAYKPDRIRQLLNFPIVNVSAFGSRGASELAALFSPLLICGPFLGALISSLQTAACTGSPWPVVMIFVLVSFAGMVALGVTVEVGPRAGKWRQPLTLWGAAVAPTGSGKTPVCVEGFSGRPVFRSLGFLPLPSAAEHGARAHYTGSVG